MRTLLDTESSDQEVWWIGGLVDLKACFAEADGRRSLEAQVVFALATNRALGPPRNAPRQILWSRRCVLSQLCSLQYGFNAYPESVRLTDVTIEVSAEVGEVRRFALEDKYSCRSGKMFKSRAPSIAPSTS